MRQYLIMKMMVRCRYGTHTRAAHAGGAIWADANERFFFAISAPRSQTWYDSQLDLDPERLVFIDETGASTKLARRHGWALRGQRLRCSVPHVHWKTTTFVGVLRLSGMTVPMVLDGPMNGAWFLAYVQ